MRRMLGRLAIDAGLALIIITLTIVFFYALWTMGNPHG